MRRILLILGSLFFAISLSNAQNTFPINLPLTSQDGLSVLQYTTKGSSFPKTLPNFSSNGMMLSVDEADIFSGAYFTNLSFSINRGFVIEFEYEVYSINQSSLGRLGDGFALVLFDGATTSPQLGYSGSALGYAYNRNNTTAGNKAGLSGGFLGIGFDTYGHFNQQGFDITGDWRNGLPLGAAYTYFYNAQTDFVTIRGPVNKALDATYGVNKAGYPMLISQNTYNSYASTSTTLYYSQLLSDWTIYYDAYSKREVNNFTPFTIAGKQKGATYLSSSYRKAKVEVIPDKSTAGVFYVSVSIVIDNLTSPRQVIKKYKIDTNGTVKYPEVKTATSTAVGISSVMDPQTMSMKAPSTLKLGWTASTGDTWAYTVIKNASVTLPYTPIVVNDAFDICRNTGSYSTFNPLSNDYGYNVALTDPTPDNAYLDKASFRFMVPKASGQVGYQPNDASNPYVLDKNNIKYTYDPATGTIKSEPKTTIVSGTTDVLYYDIRNKNTTDDEYRSKVATISLTINDNNCTVAPTLKDPVANNDIAGVCTTPSSTGEISPIANDLGYTSGSTTGSSSNIDLSSFTFTNAAGTTVNPNTTNATYSYNSSTGKLTITRTSTAITSGTKDVLYYKVKNKNGSVFSNIASITITFADSNCAVSNPVANNDIVGLCNTVGSTGEVYPVSNDLGYVAGSTAGSSSNIDLTSLTFTNAAGTTVNPNTTNATYSYNSSTGKLTITRTSTAIASGTKDVLYYKVKNKNGSVFSNIATITVTFASSNCTNSYAEAPSISYVDVDDICSASGTTTTIDPFSGTGTTGYAVVDGVQKSGKEYIDKSSFMFTNSSGVSIGSNYVYGGKYATYTYSPTTGIISVLVVNNTLSGEDGEVLYFTVTNLDGGSRSNTGTVIAIYDSSKCSTVGGDWIKINGSVKGMFVNGIGNFNPN